MMRRLFFLLLPVLMVPAAQAQTRLLGQRVLGAQRICTYANPDINRRRIAPYVIRRIGAGEPCLARYPGPQRTPAPQIIPTMATLVGQRVQQGRLVCEYEYLGRRYTRANRLDEPCPYTPHFTN